MIIKLVSLFLIGMLALAMFGRLKMPKVGKNGNRPNLKARKCKKCGSYILGKGACACEKRS